MSNEDAGESRSAGRSLRPLGGGVAIISYEPKPPVSEAFLERLKEVAAQRGDEPLSPPGVVESKSKSSLLPRNT